jgi:hypothetical protein
MAQLFRQLNLLAHSQSQLLVPATKGNITFAQDPRPFWRGFSFGPFWFSYYFYFYFSGSAPSYAPGKTVSA